VQAVGCNDKKKKFIVRNSLGTGYGVKTRKRPYLEIKHPFVFKDGLSEIAAVPYNGFHISTDI